MRLVINGQSEEIDVETMHDLLNSLDLARQRVAVEINGELVTRGAYASTRLSEGDRIEIVTFVGGG
jgi:sulfur carrier protein